MFAIRFPTFLPLALLAVFSLAACGGKQPPPAADPAPKPAAGTEAPPAEPIAMQTVGSRQACELLDPSDVELILGSVATPAPRLEAQTAGVAMAACAWELAAEGGEVVLIVVEGEGVAASELEGEAADGVGDAAVLRLRGDNRVKVAARVGGRMMTLEAIGPAVVERKDAVIAAARGAAERLRSIPEAVQ
jgi:predicted small lipoprotein YifL